MKSTYKIALLLFLCGFAFQSCQDNDDVATGPNDIEIQNFIWKGLNQYYLWQPDVPNLNEKKYASQDELNIFLKGFPVPEELFQSLLNKPSSLYPDPTQAIDRFSWIVSDYLELEGQLQGTTKNNGIDFGLSLVSNDSDDVYGYVRYIIPNSDAATKNILRGEVFYAVNGTKLTRSNYSNLLFGSSESYTLNFATISTDASSNTVVTPNGKSIDLTKTVLNENPILINKIINEGSHKIGYLMYNGFFSNYDSQLNNAFGSLIGVTDLVLDLRYNGGGSVNTATQLASMITGQFKGQTFSKLKWNDKNSDNNTNYQFVDPASINSLNLTTVYVLTSKSTASASEMIINGLKPYIKVVQIGDLTYGKNVASRTLYDSPTFGSSNRNPNHRYAMQPIVAHIVNSVNFGDYLGGLTPDYLLKEKISTLGILGDRDEPLLSTAIGKITGTGRMIKQNKEKGIEYFTDSKALNHQNQMYIENTTESILKDLD
ncbi:C-terminal processing protease CtpA/Prc [Flavobacterium sp. 7E]|uniref:S41 family peptidase n=1 Tax=Flavobacterium sp. 7E TaxID=2735898 RepID=UPI00156E2046|nr:S41 family peptidase [Flavobacterium sp. 7E]NRS89360.1 C-terminal processing protease CtpA/Prc [Flavobacterium sp. 7E]